LGSEIVASLYLFGHRRCAYFYLAGFDPRFKAFSPGMLLIGHAIEDTILEQAEEFDFLRGRESYKYRWGAMDRPTFRRIFWRRAATEQLNSGVSI
jgi:CelD/BcsL family acetyltransferase involved in cellulose biosynthesis